MLGTVGWEALGGHYKLTVYNLRKNGELNGCILNLKIPCTQKYFAPMREVRNHYLSWESDQLIITIPHERPITVDFGKTNPPPIYR